jgi:hypothetical protein
VTTGSAFGEGTIVPAGSAGVAGPDAGTAGAMGEEGADGTAGRTELLAPAAAPATFEGAAFARAFAFEAFILAAFAAFAAVFFPAGFLAAGFPGLAIEADAEALSVRRAPAVEGRARRTVAASARRSVRNVGLFGLRVMYALCSDLPRLSTPERVIPNASSPPARGSGRERTGRIDG